MTFKSVQPAGPAIIMNPNGFPFCFLWFVFPLFAIFIIFNGHAGWSGHHPERHWLIQYGPRQKIDRTRFPGNHHLEISLKEGYLGSKTTSSPYYNEDRTSLLAKDDGWNESLI